ncbi:GNAT family N-acetyltransferase [Micromonospora sp. CPCC 206061]|uniref:GNAT family N-acetyltransferase n=1 Tax=Micromonospora sp. CPCC 206061 TaxID=3122410 RepID=UPI002FF3E654
MTQDQITAPGLVLRQWRADDADAVYQACQDPDIQLWTRVPVPYGRENARHFVTELAPSAWADGTGTHFAVTDANSGELLGSCGLVSIDRVLRSAEVGYWTAPWARGRGVAVGATRTVCRWAFEALEMRRVVWQAAVGNHASRLVALRAGFRLEGELRLADGNPLGGHAGWVGSLLPGDPVEVQVDELTARRAKVFGRAQPILHAKEATLRRPDERDIDAMVAACSDLDAVRYTTVPTPYRRKDAEEFAFRIAPFGWARGAGAVFAITDPADTWVGNIDLRISADDPLIGEVGFLVAPEARGRGYATAALRAVCEWAFAEVGLARVKWRAHVGNVASRRVAEKAGFTMEGMLRGDLAHRGERRDAWIASLLPGDSL